jgi:hypothetical protein
MIERSGAVEEGPLAPNIWLLRKVASLRRALSEFVEHFHAERNHQGKGNVLLFPCDRERHGWQPRSFFCRERLGGLLKYWCLP